MSIFLKVDQVIDVSKDIEKMMVRTTLDDCLISLFES